MDGRGAEDPYAECKEDVADVHPSQLGEDEARLEGGEGATRERHRSSLREPSNGHPEKPGGRIIAVYGVMVGKRDMLPIESESDSLLCDEVELSITTFVRRLDADQGCSTLILASLATSLLTT
ncbi:hypothetical protein NDU88_006045 [Pleurodeles waltl]|uniref:Uncharacterized protein n=1 Tax=Pleurodeles waltl TaxID=8319 RepID=A0AAV7X019_PLEWA|nr:hypothetical protein NDU88_006045 [Pleurodeles waltl]